METLQDIIQRAEALKEETALNSISPDRAGSIMYDTLIYINQMQLQASNPLLISKIYASVAAMEADSAPVSDLTGKPLVAGQVVCIVTSDTSSADYGVIYRYDGTTDGVSSWTAVGEMGGAAPIDSLDSDSTVRPLAARQGKILDNSILEAKTNLNKVGFAGQGSTFVRHDYKGILQKNHKYRFSVLTPSWSMPAGVVSSSAYKFAIIVYNSDDTERVRVADVKADGTVNPLYYYTPDADGLWFIVGGRIAEGTAANVIFEDITDTYAEISATFEIGYWAIADGSPVLSDSWGRTPSYVPDNIGCVICPSDTKVYIMAYDDSDTYIGTWFGESWSTQYDSDYAIQAIDIAAFRRNYPTYKFKLICTKIAGVIGPWGGYNNNIYLLSVGDELLKLDKICSNINSAFVNGYRTSFAGQGSTYVAGQSVSVDNRKVLKFIVEDEDYPRTATSAQVVFGIYCTLANDDILRLVAVFGSDAVSKEYVVVLPDGCKAVTIGGRADAGYSCICDIIDLTDEYRYVRKLATEDYFISSAARLRAYIKGTGGGYMMIRKKNADSNYQFEATSYAVDSEHQQSVIKSCSYTDNLNYIVYELADANFAGVFGKASDNHAMSDSDIPAFVDDYEVVVYDANEYVGNTLADGEKALIMPQFNPSGNAAFTDFYTKMKQHLSINVHLPEWVKIRINHGVRTERSTTGYYYDGDIVDAADIEGSGMYIEFAPSTSSAFRISDAIMKRWIGQGLILLSVKSEDGSIMDRSHDAEKYAGAIMATPGVNGKLPLIVHVSDIHGDVTRFTSAFDFADYINADLLVNTGDNYFYVSTDGMLYHSNVVLSHKTDFANCLGNHDSYDTSVANILAKNIAPFKDRYHYYKGVDGGEPVLTDTAYYYKDLAAHNLRLIALNVYDGITYSNYLARISSEQINWFIDTLAATPAGYGVIVILHPIPHLVTPIPGKLDFVDTTMSDNQTTMDSDYMTNGKITGMPLNKIIDAFIQRGTVSDSYTQKDVTKEADETVSYEADFTNVAEGVEFICFLNGHTHRDYVGYVSDCEENQLNINVCSAAPLSQSSGMKTASDIMRDTNTANQDAFNVYTINRTTKVVGIARIGSNLNKDMTDRKVMYVSYV